jgi:hypothetical protein
MVCFFFPVRKSLPKNPLLDAVSSRPTLSTSFFMISEDAVTRCWGVVLFGKLVATAFFFGRSPNLNRFGVFGRLSFSVVLTRSGVLVFKRLLGGVTDPSFS